MLVVGDSRANELAPVGIGRNLASYVSYLVGRGFFESLDQSPLKRKSSMQYRTNREGNTTVLHISGELDCVTVGALRPAAQAVVDGAVDAAVVVDLSHLRVLDSTGVGLLVSMHRQLQRSGRGLGLRNADGQPLAVLRLLHLDRVFSRSAEPEIRAPLAGPGVRGSVGLHTAE
jgi:anti-sigma B factor antagonist